MIELYETIEYWHWLAFGALLLVVEIILPTAIFLWPGIAAIFVGILLVITPLSWNASLLIWSVLSVAMAGAWHYYRRKKEKSEPPSTLNSRGLQYIGRRFSLAKPIVNGVGEIKVDDTIWRAVADTDIEEGVNVEVISVEGTSLRVRA